MSHPALPANAIAVADAHPVDLTRPLVSADVRTVALLLGAAVLALLVYYFIGVDEGALSVFGKSMVVHEFFHDGRHFLGFPCH